MEITTTNNLPNYHIIDNFLDTKDFLKIQELLTSDDFPWYYQKSVTTQNDNDSLFYFTHLIYDNNRPTSNFFEIVFPILSKMEIKSLIRIKANLYPNVGEVKENKNHTDYQFENSAAIYYINTNNGKTIIENEKIHSIENRLLLFNGNDLHRSTYCTDSKVRININFNFF